jgi:D-alanyl-D-alanine carboxypeptidase/D-alanyl-D-alanine-endopeptidase (penicillin-binding protein 4)
MRVHIFTVRALAGIAFAVNLWIFFISAAVGQPADAPHTLAELRARIDAQLNAPRFSGALWSVKVVSLTTGKTVYEYHGDRLMSPASNSKLYTGALALDTLGGDYRIATPVYATIYPDDFGRINGDLIIAGRGDPSWKAANFGDNFTPFVAVLTNADVRQVTGDLVVDDTFFQGPPTGGSWSVEDLEDSDGAEISALSLEDNTAHIHVAPGTNITDACTLTISPPDTQIILVNRTKTIAPGVRGRLERRGLEARKLPGSKTFYVFGEMPLGNEGADLDVPVPEPAAWFGVALKEALAQNGIPVGGKVRCIEWPEMVPWNQSNLAKLGEIKSPPLRELIRGFMKRSQNLETDLIFDQLGELFRTTNSPPGQSSESLAVAALELFLAARGVPADVHFDEGSGLSRNNLTSANATAALLAVMSTNRWAGDYFNALPIAGVDGTLRLRMKDTPAFQNVRAKTGTLRWANSLSGYVTTAAREKFVFSLMLNRYDAPPRASRTGELDRIAVMLAGFSGRSDE